MYVPFALLPIDNGNQASMPVIALLSIQVSSHIGNVPYYSIPERKVKGELTLWISPPYCSRIYILGTV
jgi:hypothetical protein